MSSTDFEDMHHWDHKQWFHLPILGRAYSSEVLRMVSVFGDRHGGASLSDVLVRRIMVLSVSEMLSFLCPSDMALMGSEALRTWETLGLSVIVVFVRRRVLNCLTRKFTPVLLRVRKLVGPQVETPRLASAGQPTNTRGRISRWQPRQMPWLLQPLPWCPLNLASSDGSIMLYPFHLLPWCPPLSMSGFIYHQQGFY